MSSLLLALKKDMHELQNPTRAKISRTFFKTGKGEYGEGDVFLGLTVPQSRDLAKKYSNFSFGDIAKLIASKIHEERLIGLLCLVHNFEQGDEVTRKRIYLFYLKNAKQVNSWDLVDVSADKIVGEYLRNQNRLVLEKLARSNNLWEKRIAIVSTFQFIKKDNHFEDTLAIAELLFDDEHDLIHKATGWMLREVGKRKQKILERFLKKHYKKLPRTTLRYAIERFPEKKRKRYLLGNFR